MNNLLTTYRRRGGTLLIAGALLTAAAAVVSAVVEANTSVPDDVVRYPFSGGAWTAFTVFAAACHLLMLVGVVYLARGGFADDSRTGRVGLRCVIAGFALLFVCEFAQLPLGDQHTSNTWPSIVGSGFGLATLLLAGGMIAVGIATLRQANWSSWRRYAPLICGLLSLVVIPIQFGSVIWLGIIVFSAGYVVLGVATIGDGVRRTDRAIQIA